MQKLFLLHSDFLRNFTYSKITLSYFFMKINRIAGSILAAMALGTALTSCESEIKIGGGWIDPFTV